jgi:RNA polymerase sigma-70 factor, ECF subfamily
MRGEGYRRLGDRKGAAVIASSRGAAAQQEAGTDHRTQVAPPHPTAIGPPLAASQVELAAAMPQNAEVRPLRVKFQYAIPPLVRVVPSEAEQNLGQNLHAQILVCLPHLRAFARSLTGDRDRADDLVQSAIQRALGAAAQFTPGTNFKGWIFTILRNVYFSELRSHRRLEIPIDEANLDSHATQPTQFAGLEFGEFRRAFDTLPAEQREALVLVGADGFSYEQAAAVCGAPIGTVKSRVSRARRELGKLMSAEDDNRVTRPGSIAAFAGAR